MNIRIPPASIIDVAPGIRVEFRPAAEDPAADHAALLALARRSGAPPDLAAAVGHRCAHCGSETHGRPVLLTADDAENTAVHLSLSRASGTLALAVSTTGPVGVDLDDPAAVGRASVDAAFAPGERSAIEAVATPEDRILLTTRAWCAKEATSKLLGTGLRTPPEAIGLALPALTLRPPHHRVELIELPEARPLVAVLARTPANRVAGPKTQATADP